MPELHALASYYQDAGGALWIAGSGGHVTGMIATRPLEARRWEICRVYVDPALHGSALAGDLLDSAENHAIAAGAEELVLWTDTRFDRAHRFYEKRSYIRSGAIRVLEDISNSLEFTYLKPVNGSRVLDIAAATSAERQLAGILIACVHAGASVSFLPPLSHAKAAAFWHQAATRIGAGTKVVLAAWRGGRLVGTGMLDLGTPDNQPHRADIQKILVHPAARRQGVAREIMQGLERQAVIAGRTLLTLDTAAGSAGEALYRAEGWTDCGRIPGYALGSDGNFHDTVFFCKRVGQIRPSGRRPDGHLDVTVSGRAGASNA